MMNINAILNSAGDEEQSTNPVQPPQTQWHDAAAASQPPPPSRSSQETLLSPIAANTSETTYRHQPHGNLEDERDRDMIVTGIDGDVEFRDALQEHEGTEGTETPMNGEVNDEREEPLLGTTAATDEVWGMEIDSASSNGDTDSAIGTDIESSTMSLRESIFKYIEENGRTYHAFKQGKYILPNDEAEQDRLDLQHQLFMLSLNGALHLAPLKPGIHNVLDIGTGTGIWATEFAIQYPSANVLGSDLSPIQPLYVPPNCRFEVSDAEESWDYSQRFDYIHGRAMLSCFRDPQFITYEAFSFLRPGGWFEMQDPQMPIIAIDDTINGTALEEWGRVVCEAAAKLGRPVTNSKNYGKYMQNAGFVDIQERHFYWPVNPWPKGKKEKLVALWTQQNLMDGLQAMSMAVLTRGAGWTANEVEMLLMETRKDIKNRHIHAYVDVVVFYGRKPE